MDFEPTLKKVAGDLSGIISKLTVWEKLNDRIASSTSRINDAISPDGKVGQGSSNVMNSSLASFSGGGSSGGGMSGNGIQSIMKNSLAPTASGGGAGEGGMMGGALSSFGVGMIVKGAGNVIGGMNKSMPEVGGVLNRAAGYYNAMSMSGSTMNRGALETTTRNMIGSRNFSSATSGVESASILMGAGITAGSQQYNQILSSAGGLTQMTGMSNQAGTAALAGLTSGAGSTNLLQKFGIMAGNTATGASKTPQQIIQEIKGRLTAGRGKYTTKDVNDSYYKGNLGVSLQNSGLTPDQQAIVLKSLLGDATDSKTGPINIDSQKSMMAATAKQGGNPLQSAMTVNGSKDAAAQSAEGNYIGGANAAANQLADLNVAAGELAKTFGGLKSFLDTFQSDNAGQGFVQQATGWGQIGIGAVTAGEARGGVIGGYAAGGVVKGPGSGTSDSIATRLSAGEVVLPVSTVKKNQKTVNALLASGTGAAIGNGMSMPSRYGAGGGVAKAALGAAAGTTAAGGAAKSGVGGNGRVSLIPPVNGPLGDEFNNNAPYRHGNKHHGQDWKVSEGTVVVACADGVVADTDYSGQLGKTVHISHGNGYYTRYCHLSNSSIVSKGDTVKQGQQVAISGNTGTATTGAHLHLELMQGSQYLNPMNFMSGAIASGSTTSGSDPNSASGSSGTTGGSSAGSGSTTGMGNDPSSLPTASIGSNAISITSSGIAGSGDSLASSINGGYQGGGNTGGGGEGTDPSSLTVKRGSDLAGQIKGSSGSSSGGNNVTINLTIAKASETEARHFAKRVKAMLEEDNRMSMMGRS